MASPEAMAAIEAVVRIRWDDFKRKSPNLAREWESQHGSPVPTVASLVVASPELEAATASALAFDGLIEAIGPLVTQVLQTVTGLIAAGA